MAQQSGPGNGGFGRWMRRNAAVIAALAAVAGVVVAAVK